MNRLGDDELLGAAQALASSAGRTQPVAIERLSGGRNNQVYRLTTDDGGALFLKAYFIDARDTRARLDAEWSFLKYAWDSGLRSVPEPIAADFAAQVGLYEFIVGRKLEQADVDWSRINAAADFMLALNAAPRRIDHLPTASEACFSLAEHIATVARRVEGLEHLHPDVPHRAEAERFINGLLRPAWQRVRARIEQHSRELGISFAAQLAAGDVVASPSDFGFHNMLERQSGALAFTDFEYAGRDDPAKLVCDFFAQPDMPAPLQYFDAFVEKLFGGLSLTPIHARRCCLLLDAYRVKWACIVLNDFRPVGAAQRAFARGDSWAQRCQEQLAKAEAKMAQISTAEGLAF